MKTIIKNEMIAAGDAILYSGALGRGWWLFACSRLQRCCAAHKCSYAASLLTTSFSLYRA